MSATAVRTVDVHAHALIGTVEVIVDGDRRLVEHRALDLRRNGVESAEVSGRMVTERVPQLTRVDRRLADMDAAGIDVQVVSPSPSQYHYWADAALAVQLCSMTNEGIAALIAEAPARLVGLGLVPLQHPSRMVEALDHAVLTCGLAGVEISSHAPRAGVGGIIDFSDPDLEPFWTRAAELKATIFLHPFGCTLDERLDRFYLSNTVGQPVENAVALSHLIFAGVLDRHPCLRLIAAHGGGYLPTFLGRSDHAWQVRPEARACDAPPSAYLRRLWFDSLVHTPEALRALVAAVGADRVLLGSDYPFDMGVTDPLDRLSAADLPPQDIVAICAGNAADLGLVPDLALEKA